MYVDLQHPTSCLDAQNIERIKFKDGNLEEKYV